MAPSSRVRRLALILAAIFLATSSLVARPAFAAPLAQRRDVTLLTGTVELVPALTDAITAALHEAGPWVAQVSYFAATDLHVADGWAVVSLVGLTSVGADQSWHAEDGSWFGLAVAHESEPGVWETALQGTGMYSSLLAQVPASVLDPADSPALDDHYSWRALQHNHLSLAIRHGDDLWPAGHP